MKTPRLETDRLLLREVQETDVKEIFDCWMQDESVSKYMWWKASKDIAKAQEFVEFELQQIENEKWNRWVIILKETRKIIGTCLVFFNDEDNESHWDISYNLGKKYWGNGYMTEAMQTVMKFAERELGMTECITTYAKENSSSAKVLHKLGFQDEKDISYECIGGEIVTEGIMSRYIAG
ncbi:MAG: GNAT family N-acetyltransferase [Lachnospiraceae bacterium]